MSTLRSLAFFTALWVAWMITLIPALNWPGISALVYLFAGFLLSFPVDRVYAFWIWVSESVAMVTNHRTCVVSTPKLQAEHHSWRYLGTIRESRNGQN